jgi:hypothetical protein
MSLRSEISLEVVLLDAARRVSTDTKASRIEVRLSTRNRTDPECHRFLLMLKPEVFAARARSDLIVDIILRTLVRHRVLITRVAVANGRWMVEQQLGKRLYPRLWLVGNWGTKWLSAPARSRLQRMMVDFDVSPQNVCCARAILGAYPELQPTELRAQGNRSGCMKLGSGAYAAAIEYQSETRLVLNAFAPAFFDKYQKLDACAAFFECYKAAPWHHLRTDIVGEIFPDKAVRGSIRRELLARAAQLRTRVDLDTNFVHVSPGPLEAASQLANVFTTLEGGNAIFPGRQRSNLTRLSKILDLYEASENLDMKDATRLPEFDLVARLR